MDNHRIVKVRFRFVVTVESEDQPGTPEAAAEIEEDHAETAPQATEAQDGGQTPRSETAGKQVIGFRAVRKNTGS